MIRVFKHYVPLCGAAARRDRLRPADARGRGAAGRSGCGSSPASSIRTRPAAQHARLRRSRMQTAMVAVGVYGVEALQSVRFAVARLLVAVRARHPAPLPASSSCSRRSASGARACSTRRGSRWSRWPRSALLLRDTLGGERFKRRVLVLGAGPRAARIEALAGPQRRQLRGRRLRRHERRRPRGRRARSTATTSPACPIICSGSAPARSCWRSRSGATRCRSTTCCGSRRPASPSTISPPSSSARPGGSISTASIPPG